MAAAILDAAPHAASRSTRRCSPITQHSAPQGPRELSRVDRRVTWSVSVYRHSGDAEVHEYTSHRLTSPALVREHVDLARERPWVSRVALTEHVREVTRRAVTESELPVDEPPKAAPTAPTGGTVVARFYEIEDAPPVGLLSLDDVRERLVELHRGAAHGAGPAEAVSGGLRLWEVTVVDFARQMSDDAPLHP